MWGRLAHVDVAGQRAGACPDGSAVMLVERIRYHELSKVDTWVATVEMPLPQEIEQCAPTAAPARCSLGSRLQRPTSPTHSLTYRPPPAAPPPPGA